MGLCAFDDECRMCDEETSSTEDKKNPITEPVACFLFRTQNMSVCVCVCVFSSLGVWCSQ